MYLIHFVRNLPNMSTSICHLLHIKAHKNTCSKVCCLVWTGAGRAFGSGVALGRGGLNTSISDELQTDMSVRGMGYDGSLVCLFAIFEHSRVILCTDCLPC